MKPNYLEHEFLIQTDTITAKFAHLPIIEGSYRYLIEIEKPVQGITFIKKCDSWDKQELKEDLLKDWENHVAQIPFEFISEDHWMRKVSKVELVECELLVPKTHLGL